MKTLNTLLVAACISLFTAGCTTTSVERTAPDGSKFEGSNKSLGWKRKGVDLTLETNTNGTIKASVKIDESGSDAAGFEAVARGVVQGLKGTSPTP